MEFGITRMIGDLKALGFNKVEAVTASDGTPFAVLRGFEIKLGRFAGRAIDLALPAPPNFPQGVGAAIHVSTAPHLLPDGSVAGHHNVIASPLGAEWRYWSHNFGWTGERTTRELLAQVNRIFHDA